MSERTVVVVNPRSQGGATGRRWPDLADRLRRHLAFEAVMTSAPNDATRLAREALAAGADRIVAVGGDGTINEVVNGFFEPLAPGDDVGAVRPVRADAAFGLLPLGTGGDFRRTAGIPTDFDEAAAVLAAGKTRVIDLGRLDFVGDDGPAARLFVNICSFGVSGVVDRIINQSGKKLGKLSFVLSTMRAAMQYDNQRVHLQFDRGLATDGAADLTINTVAIANGRYFGGAMMIAPDAELDDGQFDVVALGDFGTAELMLHSRKIYAGTHLRLAKVSARRATHVEAEAAEAGGVVELDLDGENVGRLPARFTMLPQALRLTVP